MHKVTRSQLGRLPYRNIIEAEGLLKLLYRRVKSIRLQAEKLHQQSLQKKIK